MNTIHFAATDLYSRLERQLSNVLKGAFQTGLKLVVRQVLGDDLSSVGYRKAEELLRKLDSLSGDQLRVSRGAQIRARRIIEKLAEQGLLDLNAEAARALRLPNVKVSDVLASPERITRADASLYERIAERMLDDTVRDQFEAVRETVVRGLAEGVDDRTIGARLHRLEIGRLSQHSNTIARTETTRFYTLGRMRSAEEAGDLIWGYDYVVIVDDRTTDICAPIAGKPVSKADLQWVPPLHWNCRTTLRVRVKAPASYSGPPLIVPAPGFGSDPRTIGFELRRAA